MTTFAALLRAYRERAWLSQTDLARLAGCSRSCISRYEYGDRTRPERDIVAALISALALSGDDETAFLAAAFGIATPAPVDPVALRADGALRALREAGKGRQLRVLEKAIVVAVERAERMVVAV